MRNVVKGFQIAKMAVPKPVAMKIQTDFNVHHAPALQNTRLRFAIPKPPRNATIAGKNPGVQRRGR